MTVGSYQLSNKKTLWYFVIDLPPADDGKRRQYKRRGYPSETAAEKAETEARKAYGEASIGADGSVAAELNGWLSERELDIEETTQDNYRNLFRMYVYPHIGGRQLYDLDRRAVQDFYKTLLKEGGAKKKPLSPTTVRTVHRVLMKAFRDLGIELGQVRQPRPAEREDQGRKGVWTPAQSKQFLRFHRDSRLYAAWALAVVAGTRRGEIAGLRWSKVDLDNGVVYIHIQRTICGNKMLLCQAAFCSVRLGRLIGVTAAGCCCERSSMRSAENTRSERRRRRSLSASVRVLPSLSSLST